jgi:phosphoribosylformimino-5-aminoimidazole carboxamide ribotide isomerase
MIILPAIDIRGGKCVRLVQGDFDKETVYDEDPIAVARRWESMGATHLHVVDLDGAREGHPVNDEVVKSIAQSVHLLVEVGGGIRDEATVRSYLDAGVGRVILGTAAAVNRVLARLLFREFGARIAVGMDARKGRVSISAWEKDTHFKVTELGEHLVAAGCPRFIFTDISRDGTLTGPNLAALSEFARAVRVPVIASGGVSTLQDLRILGQLAPIGIEGAIIGKALYDGRIKLQDALAFAKGG